MNISELKDYLKVCIDAYNISYEIPKIIERTDSEIKSVESEIDAVKKPEYIEIPYVYDQRTYKFFLGDCAKAVITKEMFPSMFTIYEKFLGKWRKFYSYSRKIGEADFANAFYTYIGIALREGEAVWDGNGLIIGLLDKKISFPLGYKRVLKKAFQKAYSDAQRKAMEYNTPESYAQRKKQAEIEYENELDDYNIEIYPATVKRAILEKERATFEEGYENNQAALATLLNADVVHPKYRSLPALCSIYEYLDTGRCTELTGPFGAYQRYEEELSAGKIIASLQNIEKKLDTLMSNQRLLAYSIAECGSRIEQAISNMDTNVQKSLQSIENNQKALIKNSVDTQTILSDYAANSTAIRYNTERVAKITEYVNSVRLAKGEFSGFEYRYPSLTD